MTICSVEVKIFDKYDQFSLDIYFFRIKIFIRNSRTQKKSFGNITFGSDDYQNGRSCLWKIDIPADREISLKFVDDFDVEWHNWCAFDKVHIYDGVDNNRLGRFCGPKQDGKHQMKPFDGARRNKPDIDGKLAFWDKFYNTQSNTVLIGFDSDQANNNFRGFTLKWTSQKIAANNFRDVEYALNYVRKNLIKRVMNEEFVDNGASVMSRSINSIIRNANKAIYDANRPRKCTRDKSEQVSGKFNEKFHIQIDYFSKIYRFPKDGPKSSSEKATFKKAILTQCRPFS